MQFIFIFCFLVTSITLQRGSGDIVVIGGHDGGKEVADVYSLDVKDGRWSTLPSMPSPGHGQAAVFVGSTIIVTGGHPNYKEAIAMEKTTKKWSQIGNLPGIKYLHSAFVFNDGIYVMGGNNNGKDVYISKDEGKIWYTGQKSMHYHFLNKGTLHDKYFYICGSKKSPSKECEKYDPASNQWSTVASMTTARYRFGLIGLGKYVYAIGGATGENEKYDPKTDKWIPVAAMLTKDRYQHGLATDGSKIFAIGGTGMKDGKVLNSVEVYDPATKTWTFSVHPLPSPRYWMAVAYSAERQSPSCDPELPECGE